MKKLLILLMVFTSVLPAEAISWDSRIIQGKKAYEEGNFSKAKELFQQAQIEEPENTGLLYNLANSAYKLGNYDEAIQSYQSLIQKTNDNKIKQRSWYNLGNANFRQGKLEDSIQAYRESLKLNSEDTSARKNLEKALLELKKRQQEEKKRQKNQKDPKKDQKSDKDPKKDQKNNSNNESDSKNNQKDQKKSDSGEKKDSNSKPTDSNNKNPEFKPDKASISKEEAEKWLNSVNDQGKAIMKDQVLRKVSPGYNSAKDW